MRFRKKLCPRCPTGIMRIQSSHRGYFYWCETCTHTIHRGQSVDNLRVPDRGIVSIPLKKDAS